MQIIQLESFPIEQLENATGLEMHLGAWAAGRGFPWRFLAYSRPFDMQPLIRATGQDIRQLQPLAEAAAPLLRGIRAAIEAEQPFAAAATIATMTPAQCTQVTAVVGHLALFRRVFDHPERVTQATWQALADVLAGVLWKVPWLKEMVRFYDTLGRKHLRSATYYVLTWEGGDVQVDALVASLEHATGRSAQVCESLPPTLSSSYHVDEQRARFVPNIPGNPYLAVLRSHDMNSVWDATTLHALMALPFDIALAIDVITQPRGRVMRELEYAKRTAAGVLNSGQDDPNAELKLYQAGEGMRRLATESLHDMQIAVLVSAETPDQLAINLETVRDTLGSTLRFDLVAGAQRQLIKFWSTLPARQIDAPLRRYNTWSHGVGCALGLLGYHRASRTDGVAWGMDMLRRAPLFYDLFADNQAAHAVVLGKTGFGKSFFLNVVTLRAAAQLGYRVVAMDAFKNGARIEAAAGKGAICNWMTDTTPLNPLDVVYDGRDSDWHPRQVQHAIGQISLIFGRSHQVMVENELKEVLVPCDFSDEEAGVLDRVLGDIYAGVNPHGGPHDMPLLSDVIAELERVAEPEADALARRLRFKLFGSSTSIARLSVTGREMNVPSAVQWAFDYDINYFDFSEVSEHRRSFLYASLVGGFNRFMRDPRRDVKHRTLFLMDEFHYITRVEAVARLAADITKVARKYGIGLMPTDQNPATFLGNVYGRQIFENAVAKFLFHLDALPAQVMGEAMHGLTAEHVQFLTDARRGQCIATFNNDVHYMLVEASRGELDALRGS